MSVTWLHISDFHIRGGDPYDRDVVLRALVKAVAEYRALGRAPDVIFATGDIAHAGKAQEYGLASKFFDDLLAAANLVKTHLFVIPGNHDVDRDFGIGLERTLNSREHSDLYFRPDFPKPHLTLKMRAFLDWHNRYFAGIRTASETSTCGPVQVLTVNDLRLGILPINSALFCQGDDDHDKLWIGRRCLDTALSELRELKTDLNVVLVHHPLDWLSGTEAANIQAELETSAHILLRGHLHENRIESSASPEGELLRCAAGAAYQTRRWPNRALYGTLEGNQLTIFPIRYEDTPREIWTTDPSVFPRENNHERTFHIRSLSLHKADARPIPPDPLGSPVNYSTMTPREAEDALKPFPRERQVLEEYFLLLEMCVGADYDFIRTRFELRAKEILERKDLLVFSKATGRLLLIVDSVKKQEGWKTVFRETLCSLHLPDDETNSANLTFKVKQKIASYQPEILFPFFALVCLRQLRGELISSLAIKNLLLREYKAHNITPHHTISKWPAPLDPAE